MGKRLQQALIAAAALAVSAGAASAAENCLLAKGKIVGNGQFDANGQSDGSTQGVVALVLGTLKTKCAIVGMPYFDGPAQKFKHRIVCENPAASGEPQDQITFDSTVDASSIVGQPCNPEVPDGPWTFSFEETSNAIPATGRGTFHNASGTIKITGEVNCNAGIKMQFEGTMCFPD